MSTVSTNTESPERIAEFDRKIGPIGDFLLRFFLLAAGFGLTMSAFGIWVVGTTEGAPALSLMKLGVSLFMLLFGMSLIVVAKSDTKVE